jgi:hypothetical protein
MVRVSHEGSLLRLSQIVLVVKGSTTDRPSLQGVKDLMRRLGSIGLHALPPPAGGTWCSQAPLRGLTK